MGEFRLKKSPVQPKKHWLIERYNALKSAYQRRAILLHGAMIQPRIFELQLLGIPFPIHYKYTNLAGHGAFLCLAASYLETDFFYLRIYAIGGISLSIIFQYYREKALWIPIRWNFLFLLINTVMIGLLIKEAHDFSILSAEELEIYTNNFKQLGMKPIDFLHIIRAAKRTVYKPGEVLVQQNRVNGQLHFVFSGKLIVKRQEERMYEIKSNQFVGARSFLSYEGDYRKNQHAKLANDRDQFNLWNADSDSFFMFTDGEYSLDRSSVDKAFIKLPPRPDLSKWQRGLADVVSEDECIVYTWSFKDIHEILASEPIVGAAFEMCILLDLNKKMNSTWSHESVVRYKQLLELALVDDEISPAKKKYLEKFRHESLISKETSNRMVELAGWTLEEYEAGKRSKKDEVPSGWWFGWGGNNKGVIYSNASSNPLINADEVKLMAERESIEASNKASNNLT